MNASTLFLRFTIIILTFFIALPGQAGEETFKSESLMLEAEAEASVEGITYLKNVLCSKSIGDFYLCSFKQLNLEVIKKYNSESYQDVHLTDEAAQNFYQMLEKYKAEGYETRNGYSYRAFKISCQLTESREALKSCWID